VQPNINIEMYKTEKKYTIDELLAIEIGLSEKCPPGLCIWTEGSLPIRLADSADVLKQLQNLSYSKNLSLIAGTVDSDSNSNVYNSAAAISGEGQISKDFYHKRYLVPFGEYTPAFVDCLPYSPVIRSLTNTPAGTGYACGNRASVLRLKEAIIAPLICFEVIAPELAASSVESGGELLVNINDLSWFHKSIVGEEMIACAVMRAIENRRYFVFAANTGPSAIISPMGKIEARLDQNIRGLLPGKISYIRERSFYTQWLRF
jgi:apolipoprotein N-acyltransferase